MMVFHMCWEWNRLHWDASLLNSFGRFILTCYHLYVVDIYMTLSEISCPLYFSDRRLLQPAQVCDILKGVILVICYFMMHYVDYSMMYHLIRGQSVIKLYIIYNMLEVRIWASEYQACFFRMLKKYWCVMIFVCRVWHVSSSQMYKWFLYTT